VRRAVPVVATPTERSAQRRIEGRLGADELRGRHKVADVEHTGLSAELAASAGTGQDGRARLLAPTPRGVDRHARSVARVGFLAPRLLSLMLGTAPLAGLNQAAASALVTDAQDDHLIRQWAERGWIEDRLSRLGSRALEAGTDVAEGCDMLGHGTSPALALCPATARLDESVRAGRPQVRQGRRGTALLF
jgi:hypothetical protein